MRRILATVFAAVTLSTVPVLAAQDSTVAAAPETAARAAVPEFHTGQWAAQFEISNGFYGIGALHFSNPDKAMKLEARVSGNYADFPGDDTHANSLGLFVGAGPRWYRQAKSRVRPFVGLLGSVHFDRNHSVSGPSTGTNLSFGLGVDGELGATVFVTPEISVGAAWHAGLGVAQGRQYNNGDLIGKSTSAGFSAGWMGLEGAIYF